MKKRKGKFKTICKDSVHTQSLYYHAALGKSNSVRQSRYIQCWTLKKFNLGFFMGLRYSEATRSKLLLFNIFTG
jgi:hypothetical protein